MPLLGFDVVETKLVVNEEEAKQVRQIFNLYLEFGSLIPTVQEVNRRNWTSKIWTTKKETRRGGCQFNKNRLHQLLTNPTDIGKIAYKAEIHEGEHEAIVDAATFERVQQMLHENGVSGCYYVCDKAQQLGWNICPAPSVSAEQFEQFVVEEIKAIGWDPALVAATFAESRRLGDEAIQALKRERAALECQRRADGAEQRQLAGDDANNSDSRRIAEVQEPIAKTELRFAEVQAELASVLATYVDEPDVAAALAQFDDVWGALMPKERVRVLSLLIERIDYDGLRGGVTFAFRASDLKELANKETSEETAA
jgi:site-specific DNA recombinase